MSSTLGEDWILIEEDLTRADSAETIADLTCDRYAQKRKNVAITALQYQALDFPRFETRFLELDSLQDGASRSSVISSKLIHASLYAPPEYVALSYCWGDHSVTKFMTVDGHPRQITVNLRQALKALRESGVRRLWVDAVCINQTDDYERSYQVSRMGKIYSKASKVIVWLGDTRDDSDIAMQLLSDAASHEWLRNLADTTPRTKNAITCLLRRAYWQRAWVVQEIAKGAQTEVWCGPKRLEWDMFVKGVNRCSELFRVSTGVLSLRTLQEFRLGERSSRRGAARMMLSAALIKTRYAHATDPRDKIYALLELTRDGNEVVQIPNYSQDPTQVFTLASQHMICEQGQVALILLAGQRQNAPHSPSWLPLWYPVAQPDLPEWIVDCVSKDTDVKGERIQGSSAKHNGSRLTVRGFLLETVTIEEVDDATYDYRLTPKVADASQALRTLRDITGALLSCQNRQMLSDRRDDMVHALVALWSGGAAIAELSLLRSWFANHKNLLVNDRPLRFWVQECDRLAAKQTLWYKEKMVCRSGSNGCVEILKDLEDSLLTMERHHMKTVVTKYSKSPSTLRVVHRSAEDKDRIFRLEDCALPVILRPGIYGDTDSEAYTLIGEAIGRRDYKEKHWHQGMGWKKTGTKEWQLITIV